VGRLETSFGDGWKGVGAGSNNMGAIIAGKRWTGDTFEHKDSYPDAQGVNHWYVTKFRKYPNPAEGWEDLARIVYESRPSALAAGAANDSLAFSQALYRTHYYAGFGKTDEERIANHHRILQRCVTSISKELALPAAAAAPVTPTLARGSRGDLVRAWQRELGVVADGAFGPNTELATKQWQAAHGVEVDGIVHPAMWATAQSAH
jgi:hypothetical protein